MRSGEVFDYETKSSYAICIRTDDGNSGTYDKNFTININDLDETPPIIAEVTPVSSPSSDNTPDYTFSSDEAGTIAYGGDCSSSTTTASSGNNTITFNSLADGTHSNCTIQVTDSSSNASNILAVTSFSVDSAVPTIDSISSDKADGYYTVGEVIDIDVTFSEIVNSTGDVTITLETGSTDRTCAFSISSSTTETCDYTVQSGDTTSDLNVNNVAGTINDLSGNPLTNFTPATNLSDSKAISIDTTSPTITVNEGTDTGPTNDDTINVTVADTNLNTSSLEYGYSSDGTCNTSDTYGNSFTNSADFHITTDHTDYLCVKGEDQATNVTYQLVGQLNISDITPATLSNGAPSGTLASGSTTATLSLSTNENATCKYGTVSGTAYDSIANTFSTTGITSHSQNISGLSDGNSYSYYVRCEDSGSNQNTSDFTISFSVADTPAACTSFTYSQWGSCQSNGTQTRTVISSLPNGCAGGSPVLSQSCVYSGDDDEESEDVDIETLADSIGTPYAKIANYIKEKLDGDKKIYSKKKEFDLKGKDPALAGGTVKLYEDGDLEDEDTIDEDGEWKLKVDKNKNKTYTFKIKYYDENGDKVESDKYKIKIDSEDPEFTDLPGKLHKSKGDVVWWKAKDNEEVDKFKVYFNGRNHTIHAPDNDDDEEVYSEFRLPGNLSAGNYELRVKAYNKTVRYVNIVVW